jgi:pimeloyl-ACP methyl ester carboxylesterase
MPLDPSIPESERSLVFGPERAVTFGPERNLVATLTLPQPGSAAKASESPGYGVLLTNVGIMPRSGPYRLNVELARRFARIGVPTLRFDLSGLGDSSRSSDPLPNAQQWVQDTRAALDCAERECGIRRFLMIGVCSGADVAWLTAPQDERLAGVVLFDPYLYPTRRTALRALRYRLHAQGFGATARAMGNRLARQVAGLFAARSADEGDEGTLRYGPSAPPLAEFAGRIGATIRRGGRVMLLHSGSYPYHYNYAQQTTDNLRDFGLADKVESGLIREADHVLMGAAGRRLFIERCVDAGERWFGAAPAVASAPVPVAARAERRAVRARAEPAWSTAA